VIIRDEVRDNNDPTAVGVGCSGSSRSQLEGFYRAIHNHKISAGGCPSTREEAAILELSWQVSTNFASRFSKMGCRQCYLDAQMARAAFKEDKTGADNGPKGSESSLQIWTLVHNRCQCRTIRIFCKVSHSHNCRRLQHGNRHFKWTLKVQSSLEQSRGCHQMQQYYLQNLVWYLKMAALQISPRGCEFSNLCAVIWARLTKMIRYVHHFLICDMSKPSAPFALCPNMHKEQTIGLWAAGYVLEAVGAGLIQVGQDAVGDANVFTSGSANIRSAFLTNKDDMFGLQAEIVNYNPTNRTVYLALELEYLEDKPTDFLDASTMTLSATGCMPPGYRPPNNEKKYNYSSEPIEITQNGYIVNTSMRFPHALYRCSC
jgi:hypothetical protein